MTDTAEFTGYGDSNSSLGAEPTQSPTAYKKPRFQARQANRRHSLVSPARSEPPPKVGRRSDDHMTEPDEEGRASEARTGQTKVVAMLEAKVDELEAALQVATDETEVWKKRHKKRETRITKLQEEADTQILEHVQLKEQFQQLQRQQSAAEKDSAALHAEIDRLTHAITVVKDERADAERVFARQNAAANAVIADLKAQLEGKNLQIKDLGDQKTELEQKHEADNRAVAVIIRTLEAELEKAQSANPSDPALSSSHPTLRLQRSISALSSKPSVESLTMAKCTATETELLIQQLTDQNQTLQDQIEALRANPPPALSESTTGDGQAFNSLPTGNTVDYDETLRRPQSGSSPTFPKRSSSVRELLNMKPDADGNLQRSPHTSPSLLRRSRTIGGGSNTLQAELSSINRYQAEIDNLRAENLALVNYLVATLDSLNKATMAR